MKNISRNQILIYIFAFVLIYISTVILATETFKPLTRGLLVFSSFGLVCSILRYIIIEKNKIK